MSKSEDYLDGLLHSMDAKKQTWDDDETDLGIGGGNGPDQKFLDDFERELMSDLDEDDFLREFERELNGEDAPQEYVPDNAASVPEDFGSADGLDDFDGGEQERDSFFDDLDGIVNSVKESMEDAPQTFEQDDDSDFMIDTIGDMPEQSDSDFMDLLQSDDGFSDDQVMTQPDDDLESFLQDDSDSSFLDDDFMQGDDGMELSLDDFGDTGVTDMAEQTEEKKEKKPGFLQKLSRILFGESDDSEEEKTKDGKKKATKVPDIEDISDESIQLLQQLGDEISAEGAAPEPEPEPEPKKEKKKKKKKGKKKKGEKSDSEEDSEDFDGKKTKKPKKPKKEKPKKEKKPKEPDNSPPLPRKPVILVFVMVASMLALVLIGTNLVGYSNSISLAKKQYALGNYAQALQEISGMEIKKEDTELYQKCCIMAGTAGEYSAYRSFMETGIYDMALDTLVRTVGRCEKYSSDAVTYGCENELAKVREQAVASLAGFGITEERALQIYENEDRNAYSTELNQILADAGLLREKE